MANIRLFVTYLHMPLATVLSISHSTTRLYMTPLRKSTTLNIVSKYSYSINIYFNGKLFICDDTNGTAACPSAFPNASSSGSLLSSTVTTLTRQSSIINCHYNFCFNNFNWSSVVNNFLTSFLSDKKILNMCCVFSQQLFFL